MYILALAMVALAVPNSPVPGPPDSGTPSGPARSAGLQASLHGPTWKVGTTSGAGLQDHPPCATCIVLTIAPGQALALPEALNGLDVLVRVNAEPREVQPALAEIVRKGGRPGLVMDGVPDTPIAPALLSVARVVLIELGTLPPDADWDATAYAVKMRFTSARAAAPAGILWGIVARRPAVQALLGRDVGPYIDIVASPDDLAADRTGHAIWRVLQGPDGPPKTADEALKATQSTSTTTRADRWLWRVPEGVDVTPIATPEVSGRIVEEVEVVGSRTLTVDEIVARHQAVAVRQAALVRTLISTGTLTLSFEAPGFPAPITITSQAIVYMAPDRTELEQRKVRVNGIEFPGGGVPRLPIIEPERVASPPLTITLTGLYRYRLDGDDSVGGTRCHVVAFEPLDTRQPLFRGRAWIAMDTFAMVRVAAAQTALGGPIVSSEQVDDYRLAQDGIWLLSRSDVRQTYEGAAHRTPIHRVLTFDRQEINPWDFEMRRQSAYASASLMLRDTPEGYRYLRKETAAAPAGQPAPAVSAPAVSAPAVPVLAARADRVRTFATGVIIDPNITRPLPFAGLSYVDFNLFGTGAQLNAFFGGTYGQLAFSVPSLGGRRWQLAGRAFGIASSYNDRAFISGREQYAEDIRQRPAHASVWLLRRLTPRISVRAGYDLDYTHFAPGEATAADFAVPADQVVHAAKLSLDAQRGGWNGSVWWSPARRSGWRAWGRPGSGGDDPGHGDFQRAGVWIVRSAVLSPRLAGKVEGAWMAGRDLDRFSRYSFGTFDNRLRGYPSALIRYDRGGVVRGALAWAAGRFVRIDGFLDSATVHDPGFGRGLRNYTGIGAAVEAPAPFGTLVAVEWGYGLRGVNADGSLGTHVIRISGFKVF